MHFCSGEKDGVLNPHRQYVKYPGRIAAEFGIDKSKFSLYFKLLLNFRSAESGHNYERTGSAWRAATRIPVRARIGYCGHS
jgi:ABC-type microcin C transport system permease subunit YejB